MSVTRFGLMVTRAVCAVLAAVAFSVALGAAPALAAESDSPGFEPQYASWYRISGANRYETSAKIAAMGFPDGSNHAVVVTGKNFPDALTASALAGARDCPILLTTPNALHPATRAALKSLRVKVVAIVGGEAAVSAGVANEIKAMGLTVERFSGKNRIDTSVAIFKHTINKTMGDRTVFIATGTNFPDALSVGPLAFRGPFPILLVGTDGKLTPEEVNLLSTNYFDEAIIMGGYSAVSHEVEEQVKECRPAASVQRFGGASRYETSAFFAEWALDHYLLPGFMTVATGQDYPDALCGAALCGVNGAPLLLAKDTSSPALQKIKGKELHIVMPYILGGEKAVSASLETYLNSLTQ